MSKLQSSKAAATADFQYDFIFLRSAPADGVTARKHIEGGFAWPTGPDAVGRVIEAPDWDPSPSRDCGGGLHGLPSGIGDWGLVLSPSDMSVLWYVCGASMEEAVFGSGKVRVRRCRILYVGHFGRAMDLISPAMTAAVADLAARRVTTAGESAASNSGYSGAASSVGRDGVALAAGIASRGMVSNGSLLVLIERDENGKMLSYFAAREGERGIQAGHWYTLRAGYPVEVDALGEELVQKSSTL